MYNSADQQSGNERYEELCEQGFALIQSKSSREALASLDAALQLRADDHKAYHYQGLALHKLGMYEEAVASYNKALEIKPERHEIWSDRGFTLYVLGRCEEAFFSYYKALKIEPDYIEAQEKRKLFLEEYQRAQKSFKYPLAPAELALDSYFPLVQNDVQRELEQCRKKIASYSSQTEQDSKAETYDSQREPRMSWFRQSELLLKLERYEEAASSYETSFGTLQDQEIDRCSFRGVIPVALYNQGVALYNLQRVKSALAKFDEALQQRQSYLLPLYGRALSLEKLNQLEESIASLDRALEINLCYAAAWYKKGALLEKLGHLQEVTHCYQTALDISRAFGNQQIEQLVRSLSSRLD
ncbi:MAG TPA: tetratricopeptide repeat protein [Chroococcidiopsis sp.]